MKNRPNWTDYMIGLSFIIAQRSPDEQTSHGCVLCDNNYRILGMGYNGFPRNINDKDIPATRPDKYNYIIHAEQNAIFNCSVSPHIIANGIIAFVTGKPCIECLKYLIQSNTKKIIYANRQGTQLESDKTNIIFDRLVSESKIQIEIINPNLSWIVDGMNELIYLGFIK